MTRVLLEGDDSGLRLLAALFRDDPVVVLDDERYYLQARAIDDGLSDHTYADVAERLIELMNGAARLQHQGPKLPVLTSEWDQFPEGYEPNAQVQSGIVSPDLSADKLSPKEARNAVALAAARTDVALALSFLSACDDWDITWFDLAKVYEIMRQDMGNRKFVKFWPKTPKDAQSAFAMAANSFSASGRAARHAPENTSPSTHAMSKGEAKAILYPMVRRWLKGLDKSPV